MRTPKYVQVFDLLRKEAEREKGQAQLLFNHDLIVEDPTQFLEREIKIGYTRALNYLNQLESIGAIVLERVGVGRYFQSARIMKDRVDPLRHELDEDDRLIRALWRYKSKSQSGSWIVHVLDFDRVQRMADLYGANFYCRLHMLEKNGLVCCVRKGRNNRMLYVALTERFLATANKGNM